MGGADRNKPALIIEARQGLIGAALGLVVSAGLGGLGALPLALAALLVSIFFAAGLLAVRRLRRSQAAMALVLRDSSAAGSARKAVELVRELLEDKAPFGAVDHVAEAITARRRHPHTAMLARARSVLAEAERHPEVHEDTHRRRAVAACDEALRLQAISRTQTVGALATVLDDLATTIDIVLLYGYSSVVCEGIIASPGVRALPIWIAQDLQYGGHSVDEHDEVRKVLTGHGIKVEVISYDAVHTVLGHADKAFVRTTEYKLLPLMDRRRVLAIIGCEAYDDLGHVLVPAVVEGVPSETARFAELTTASTPEGAESRLLVVGESVKKVASCQTTERRTQVPLPTTWWRKPLHYLGIVTPFSGLDVTLVDADVGAHNIVSDLGPIADPPAPLPSSAVTTPKTTHLGSLDLDGYSVVVVDLDSVLTDARIMAYERLAELVTVRGSRRLHLGKYQALCHGLDDRQAVHALAQDGLLAGQPEDIEGHLAWLITHPELTSPAIPTFVRGAHPFVARLRSRTARVGVMTQRDRDWALEVLRMTFLGDVLTRNDVLAEVQPTRAYRQFANLAWVGVGGTLPALFISADQGVVDLALSAGHQGLLLDPSGSSGGDLTSLSAALVEGHSDPLNQLRMGRLTGLPVKEQSSHDVLARADLDPDTEQQYLQLCRAGFPERSWDTEALRRRALSEHLASVLTVSDPERPEVLVGASTLHEGENPDEAKLHWVVVSPEWRGKGVGRALTTFSLSAARDLGYARISLVTEASRTGAIALYESCGFTRWSHHDA